MFVWLNALFCSKTALWKLITSPDRKRYFYDEVTHFNVFISLCVLSKRNPCVIMFTKSVKFLIHAENSGESLAELQVSFRGEKSTRLIFFLCFFGKLGGYWEHWPVEQMFLKLAALFYGISRSFVRCLVYAYRNYWFSVSTSLLSLTIWPLEQEGS